MAKIIAKCPNCGHSFIIKKKNDGIMGAVVGAAVCSAIGLSVTIGTVGLGAPVAGAIAGFALTHKSSSCTCPKCETEFEKPNE